jgi:tetratricopeptide repeat protein 21B
LDEALKLHISLTKTLRPGYDYFIKLNPDFLLTLASGYLAHIGIRSMLDGKEPTNSCVTKGTKLLETIIK